MQSERDLKIFEFLEQGGSKIEIARKHKLSESTVDRIWREQRAAKKRKGGRVRNRHRKASLRVRNFNWDYTGFLSTELYLLYKLYREGATGWKAERRLRLNGIRFIKDGGSRYRGSFVSHSIHRLFHHDGPVGSPADARLRAQQMMDAALNQARHYERLIGQLDLIAEYNAGRGSKTKTPAERQGERRAMEVALAELNGYEVHEVKSDKGFAYVRIDIKTGVVLSASTPLTKVQGLSRVQCVQHCKRLKFESRKLFPHTKDESK